MSEEEDLETLPAKKYSYRVEWSFADTKRLCHLYLSHECLWNPDNPKYREKAMKTAAYKSIIKAMGKKDLTMQRLICRISTFRSRYAAALRNEYKQKQGEPVSVKKKWPFFELFDQYLGPIVRRKLDLANPDEAPSFESCKTSNIETMEVAHQGTQEMIESSIEYNSGEDECSALEEGNLSSLSETKRAASEEMDNRLEENLQQNDKTISSTDSTTELFTKQLTQLLYSVPGENTQIQVIPLSSEEPTVQNIETTEDNPYFAHTRNHTKESKQTENAPSQNHYYQQMDEGSTLIETERYTNEHTGKKPTLVNTGMLTEDNTDDLFAAQLLELIKHVKPGKQKMQMQLRLQRTVLNYIDT